MSAILEGRPEAAFLYFPSLFRDPESEHHIDLFPAIQSYTYTTSLFGPQVLLIMMTDKNFDKYLNNKSEGILRAIVGDKSDQLVMQITNTVKSWNADTGEPTVKIEFKSIPSASKFAISKKITGGLINIMDTMLDMTYSERNMLALRPSIYSQEDPSVFGEQLVNFQTISEYVAESREYAIDIDHYPIYIWEDRNNWYIKSLKSLIDQEPIRVVVTTTKKVGQSISMNETQGGQSVAFGVDFREEVSADTQKIREQYNTRYVVPRTGGDSFDYTRLDGSNEGIQKVKVLYQPYNHATSAKNGVGVVLADIWRTTMSCSRASIVMYNPSCWCRPGMLLTVIIDDVEKDYIVAMNFTEGSSKNGMQTISLIGLEEVYNFRDSLQSMDGTIPLAVV